MPIARNNELFKLN